MSRSAQLYETISSANTNRESGFFPIKDDLHPTLSSVEYCKILEARFGECSENIRERVVRSRKVQEKRFQNSLNLNNYGMGHSYPGIQVQFSDASYKIL